MTAAPSEGVPLRWLVAFVQECERKIPTSTERDSARVSGMDKLVVVYTDELTPEEQMRDELVSLKAMHAAAMSALPRDGEAMTAEQVQALRRALVA